MKPNYNNGISISALMNLEPIIKSELLIKPEIWNTLDVDYFPPRVERLWTQYGDFRIFLHTIHQTNEKCLYHKHRWPGVFKQLKGAYEMGITFSEKEISSDEAHDLPDLAKFVVSAGSYYEMTQTDALHYVRPITDVSYSIMLTKSLYPEAEFRKEILLNKLSSLTDNRKMTLLSEFNELM